MPLERLGDLVELERPLRDLPRADGAQGEVLHVDTYGNLITNLPRDACRRVSGARGQRAVAQPYYAAAQPGELLALVGSAACWRSRPATAAPRS